MDTEAKEVPKKYRKHKTNISTSELLGDEKSFSKKGNYLLDENESEDLVLPMAEAPSQSCSSEENNLA